jgi:hypothetical protein
MLHINLIAKTRYNPHANLGKPWHSVVQDWRHEGIACTLPQYTADEADEEGAQLMMYLTRKEGYAIQRGIGA